MASGKILNSVLVVAMLIYIVSCQPSSRAMDHSTKKNKGDAVTKHDTAVGSQSSATPGGFYHPDYRKDHTYGDDPYRYHRW